MILEDILEILKQKDRKTKAYTIGDKSYTYEEFYKFICNLYQCLLKENPAKKPVVVYGHKDVYMKATFLACSFAGMTYIPIDENMPKERAKSILEQVNPGLIVGDLESDLYRNISRNQICEIMNIESYNEIDQIYLQPTDIYYIIFTSGSTGVPKGVKITYKNLNSCINWLKNITKINKGVILNQANFSFDLSVCDLYLSVVTGSEHYILENNIKMNFSSVFKELKMSNSTLAVMTPSFADLLLLDKSFNQELMPNLKTMLFCGEKLLKSTVQKLYARFENINIINTYGPTECTFAVTSIELSKELANQENIPIGKPKDDVDIIILDENKNRIEDGKVGEILVVGESVSAGYLGDANKESFIEYSGKNAYLTGDLGYIQNGILYFISRKDKQIKYKGYRIEISDIEKNLYHLNYIEKAVTVTKKSNDGKVQKIIAFVKLKENANKEPLEIKKELLNKIPEYMCPIIKIVNEFPLNKNGKCDEKKLLEEV